MKIREFVFEISANERERRRKEAALRARQEQQEREEAQRQEELKRQQRKASKIQQKMDPKAAIKSNQPQQQQSTGLFSDPRLDIFRINPNIDTSFEGGYYLNFYPDIETGNMLLFWGRSVETIEQARMVNQVRDMGRAFKPRAFQALIDEIVNKTTVGANKGYCHINIPRKLLTHPYVSAAYSYLLSNYPQPDEKTVFTSDAHVAWELV